MKRSITWHQECQSNGDSYAKKLKAKAELELKYAERQQAYADFRQLQIDTAIKQGKDSFDNGSFLKKLRPE